MINEVDCDPDTEGRPIDGFPGYCVTADGEIWTKRTRLHDILSRTENWRKIRQINNNGYRQYGFRNKNGLFTRRIHALVLTAFVGPKPEGLIACHKDGNRSNNKLSNLRWDTKSANEIEKRNHGTSNQGEGNAFSKLTSADIPRIRALLDSGASLAHIGRVFGVSATVIAGIRDKKGWTHVK